MITPFVPHRAIELLNTKLEHPTGTLLFIDISRFTELSERLGKFGKAGTEELTQILNIYFGKMLSIIEGFGGNVLKFGGDALFISFYGDEYKCRDIATCCAQELMHGLHSFSSIQTVVGTFELSTKVIVQSGDWFETIIGDERRSELLLAGKAVKILALIEDMAQSGEIFVDGKKFTEPFLKSDKKSFYSVHQKSLESEMPKIERFLPQGVIDFVNLGIQGEHRAASTIFVNFYGYTEDNPEVNALQEFFIKIIDIVDKFRGSINKIDIAFKGSKLMITFGAPIAHENETAHAVLAAMDLAKLDATFIKLNIGLSSGFVYAGIVGSNYAKEYAVIGDTVNTAARLASTANPNEPVISESTQKLVEDDFDFCELIPVKVKGKESPLRRFVPVGKRLEKHYRFEFVGREKEIDSIINTVKKGRGFITIVGEPGIGKSRVLYEITKMIDPGYKVLIGTADELKGAFSCFADMVAGEAHIDTDESENMKCAKLEACICEIDPDKGELYHRLPFLGAMLFHIPYPGSIYEQVDAKLRFENLSNALKYYIERALENSMRGRLDGKLIIIIDDAQWLTEQDIELLNYLTRMLLGFSQFKNNITFIFASRHKPDIINRLSTPEGIEPLTIKLTQLDRESTDVLLKQMLHNKPLSADVLNVLNERTGGNPFYLEQFLLNLIEKKLIEETPSAWVKSVSYREEEFPETIWSAIMSRIDRLEMFAKECLRVGSVIGLEFTERVVETLLGKDIKDTLTITEDLQLTYKRIIKETEYIFRHTLVRDVIYDSILRERRRKLHKSVGETIEKIYKDELERFYSILAYHFNHTGEWQKTLDYSIKAGDKAKSEYRNDEAIKYYMRGAEVIKERFPDSKEELSSIYERLGKIYDLTAQYSTAVDYYKEMSAILPGDFFVKAKSIRLKAVIVQKQSRYDEALDLVKQAHFILKSLQPTVERKIELSLVLGSKCNVQRIRGDIEDAMNTGNEAIDILIDLSAENKEIEEHVKRARAEAVMNLCGVYYYTAQYDKAIERYAEAVTIYNELNDKLGLSRANNHLGLFYHGLGDYSKAVEFFERGAAIYEELGDKRGMGMAHGNLGLVFRDSGDYEKAAECFERHLSSSEELGDQLGVAIACGNIGVIYQHRGDYEKAIEYYGRQLSISEELGHKRGVSWACSNLGSVYLILADYTKAIALLEQALDVSKELGDEEAIGEVNYILASVLIKKGEYKRARDLLGNALDILERIGNKHHLIHAFNAFCELCLKDGSDLGKVQEYADKAYKLSKELGEKSSEAVTLLRSAEIHAQRETEKAESCFEQAIKLFEELSQKEELAEAWFAYGVFLRQHERSEYEAYLGKSKEAFEDLKLQHKVKEIEDFIKNITQEQNT